MPLLVVFSCFWASRHARLAGGRFSGLGNLKSRHTAKGLNPVLTGVGECATRLRSMSSWRFASHGVAGNLPCLDAGFC